MAPCFFTNARMIAGKWGTYHHLPAHCPYNNLDICNAYTSCRDKILYTAKFCRFTLQIFKGKKIVISINGHYPEVIKVRVVTIDVSGIGIKFENFMQAGCRDLGLHRRPTVYCRKPIILPKLLLNIFRIASTPFHYLWHYPINQKANIFKIKGIWQLPFDYKGKCYFSTVCLPIKGVILLYRNYNVFALRIGENFVYF